MKEQADHWDRLSVHPPDASVIDPGDRSGRKNRYIASVRDESILESLNGIRADSVVLDFGCGTGSLTRALVASGRHVLGVDISAGLLQRTPERALGDSALFVRYDGTRLPVADASSTTTRWSPSFVNFTAFLYQVAAWSLSNRSGRDGRSISRLGNTDVPSAIFCRISPQRVSSRFPPISFAMAACPRLMRFATGCCQNRGHHLCADLNSAWEPG